MEIADEKVDKLGIASAVLCTVHCLVVPFLFLMKFSWAEHHTIFELPKWWEFLDYLFLLISFWAVYHSAGHTLSKTIKLSLWLFWLVLATSILFEKQLHWMAYLASAGLVTTHMLNIRRMKMGLNVKTKRRKVINHPAPLDRNPV